MPRKESEAIPEGNGPVPHGKENSGLANPCWTMYIEWLNKSSVDGTESWTKWRKI